MKRNSNDLILCVFAMLMAVSPLYAAGDVSPFSGAIGALGPMSMYWLCSSRKHKSIGGWLLYFYIQIYVAVIAEVAVFYSSNLPYLDASRWRDATPFYLYVFQSITPLVVIGAEGVVATIMLKKREWEYVSLFRLVLAAHIVVVLAVTAIDAAYQRANVSWDFIALAWPVLALLYFSLSKRVRRVFQTHDWELPPVVPGQAQTAAKLENFDLRFFLSADEFQEGVAVKRGAAGLGKSSKHAYRVLSGIGAAVLLVWPYFTSDSWPGLLRKDPNSGTLLLLAALLAWIAAGAPGFEALNLKANRLDLERQIMCTTEGVDITHGANKLRLPWSQCKSFQETERVFVLNTSEAQFWTIPKRILTPDRQSAFRSLLASNLRKK